MRIAINYPAFLLGKGDPVFSFHGYNRAFVKKYADAIYVQNYEKAMQFRNVVKEPGFRKEIEIIRSVEHLNEGYDVLIGFHVGLSGTADLEFFKGLKIFHTLDYYLDTTKQCESLKNIKADYVIGHSQLDEYSDFFQKYYDDYVGRVISLPFGYGDRFINEITFLKRKNKAVGLGSINMVKDAMCTEEQTKECVDFFKGRVYTHETRKYIQDNADALTDCIDALFPSPDKQKDFSYDAVKMLNSYRMFVNDAGMSNFPPARTYEGIACGCVMVAEKNPIYDELGFIPDVNYVSFEKGNYQEMVDKIRYYMIHEEQLIDIQEKSLILSKKYSHEKVADILYKKVEQIYKTGR